MALVFTILGISIISTSIGGAKRTEVREDEIVTNLEAVKVVNEGIAYIKATINKNYTPAMKFSDYKDLVKEITEKEAEYTIKDLSSSSEFNINIDADFTRVFDVSAQAFSDSQVYSQRIYITAMPSFLKYALGSRQELTMNGSVYIKEGNTYAKEALYISNEANYIFNHIKTVPTELSVMNSDSILEVYGSMKVCTVAPCYEKISNDHNVRSALNWKTLVEDKLADGFDQAPIFYLPHEKFVEVDIPTTFVDKLAEINVNAHYSAGTNKIEFALNPLKKVGNTKNTSEGESSYINGEDDGEEIDGVKWVFLEPNMSNNLFSINKGEWLVIDGNAHIENIGNETLNVSANLLITGNLKITGDVAFDSTTYVLGDVEVLNANISGYGSEDKKGELILMNEKTLTIAKINKFNEPDISKYELNTYFYTASDAKLYAVGSYISITGGLFANGDLEVNSYRGMTANGDNDLTFTPSDEFIDSRLVISNNKRLFLNQAQGLPRVNHLQFITDTIQRN